MVFSFDIWYRIGLKYFPRWWHKTCSCEQTSKSLSPSSSYWLDEPVAICCWNIAVGITMTSSTVSFYVVCINFLSSFFFFLILYFYSSLFFPLGSLNHYVVFDVLFVIIFSPPIHFFFVCLFYRKVPSDETHCLLAFRLSSKMLTLPLSLIVFWFP